MSNIYDETYVRAKRLIFAEGKTKIIAHDPECLTFGGLVISKDDITAGDGKKRDIMKGKSVLANQTTCNVFRLLKSSGIDVAFTNQLNSVAFSAPLCKMLPYEVVVRREAHGSFLKRSPHLAKGHIFPRLVLEFFLKTKEKKWKEHPLICDDPLMVHNCDSQEIYLYDPKQPNLHQNPAECFLILSEMEVFSRYDEEDIIKQMENIARQTFLVLEKAWQLQGQKLVDFKVEFGINQDGTLLLADVIDNDSWRVVDGVGNYIDKQVYRDGGDLNDVLVKYQQVAEFTSRFSIPFQRLIIWRGSDKDDISTLERSLNILGTNPSLQVLPITCSVHKQPALAYRILQQHLQEVPDTVIIAFIGRSNGAGPTLSANTTVPVITVPANYKEFPNDIWSSLRTPSNVPVETVLEPENATLAALKILAMRNPSIYSTLRFDQEKCMTDI